jgi:hypothetical protein
MLHNLKDTKGTDTSTIIRRNKNIVIRRNKKYYYKEKQKNGAQVFYETWPKTTSLDARPCSPQQLWYED